MKESVITGQFIHECLKSQQEMVSKLQSAMDSLDAVKYAVARELLKDKLEWEQTKLAALKDARYNAVGPNYVAR